MTLNNYIHNLWLWKCGLPEDEPTLLPDLESLRETEWSPEFESHMRNRLIMGGIRYGLLRAEGKPQYDRINSIINRLNKYRTDGNLEHLVDSANLCLCEFEECHHPRKHWGPQDDTEHTTKI